MVFGKVFGDVRTPLPSSFAGYCPEQVVYGFRTYKCQLKGSKCVEKGKGAYKSVLPPTGGTCHRQTTSPTSFPTSPSQAKNSCNGNCNLCESLRACLTSDANCIMKGARRQLGVMDGDSVFFNSTDSFGYEYDGNYNYDYEYEYESLKEGPSGSDPKRRSLEAVSKNRVFFGSLEYEEEGSMDGMFCAANDDGPFFLCAFRLNPSACKNRIECNQGNVFGNGEDDVYFKWDDASSECIYLDEKHPAYQNCRDCSCGNNDPFLCKLLGEDSCTYKPIDICSFTYEAKAQNLNGSVIKTCPPRINGGTYNVECREKNNACFEKKRGNRNEGVKGMCIAATQAPTNAPTEKPGPQLACRMLSTKAKCNQFSRLGCKFKNGKCDLDLKLAAKVYPSPTCTLGEIRCVEVKYLERRLRVLKAPSCGNAHISCRWVLPPGDVPKPKYRRLGANGIVLQPAVQQTRR